MIQDIVSRLEKQIAENLLELELIDKNRAEKVKSSKEYADYIKSKEWQATRQRIFRRDDFRCVRCGCSKNLEVHHITYKNLGEEKDDDLATLCDKCHNDIHNPTTIDYLAMACVNAYKVYDNASNEKTKANAEREIIILKNAAEEIAEPNSHSKPTADILYLFAYAIRMGERYDNLDADLKLSESDFPPELKDIFGSDVTSVINKCLIGAGDREINEAYAEMSYLRRFLKITEQKEEDLLNAFSSVNDETKQALRDAFNKQVEIKRKAKDLMGEL